MLCVTIFEISPVLSVPGGPLINVVLFDRDGLISITLANARA